MSKLAVVRVQGEVDARKDVKDTLRILHLTRPNHCVILDDESSSRGMLQKVKEMITWGPVKSDVLEELLRKRGEFEGGDPVTNGEIEERTSYSSIEEFAKAVCEGNSSLSALDGLKEVFRLRPPKKEYNSTHRSFHHGGAVGNRGEEINDLILRMV